MRNEEGNFELCHLCLQCHANFECKTDLANHCLAVHPLVLPFPNKSFKQQKEHCHEQKLQNEQPKLDAKENEREEQSQIQRQSDDTQVKSPKKDYQLTQERKRTCIQKRPIIQTAQEQSGPPKKIY